MSLRHRIFSALIELEAAGWGVANFYGVVNDAGKGVGTACDCDGAV